MRPRIEIAEVVSFRLTLPHATLEQTVADLSSELPISLDQEGTDLVLTLTGGDCSLRFAPMDGEVALTEVLICNDEGGAFFSRVLARLVAEHEGDLEVRLVWNAAARNTHGTHATVAFRRGRPAAPSPTASPGNVLRDAAVAGGEPSGELFPAPQQAAADQRAVEEEEIRRILERARAEWAEYQRLKAARS